MKKLLVLAVLFLSTFGQAAQQKAQAQIPISIWIQHLALLGWQDSDANVAFHVYRSATSGSGYVMISISPVTTKSYTDATIQSGATYYYVVSAFDLSTGLESGYSAEVKAVVPVP